MFSIDVVFEILILLPTKSLMRFKCVDRSWNDIFTTPIFINRNMHILNKEKERMVVFDRTRPRFMISAITENDNELELDFPPFPVVVDDNNNINYHNNITEIQVCGESHNGVFFVRGRCSRCYNPCQLFLWNPSTREIKLFPVPPFQHYQSTYYNYVCGFGSDPNTNDFKVIYIFQISEKNTNKTILNTFYREYDELSEEMFVYPHRNLPPSVELYNLGTNSWTLPYQEDTTLLPSECQHIIPQRDGTLVNGVSHWLAIYPSCMLCFDFRDNQFRKVELPPEEDNKSFNDSRLVNISNSIAFVSCHNQFENWVVEVWILEQDTCCWTKKYIFELFNWEVPIYNFWKDGAEFLGPSRYRESYRNIDDEEPMYLASYNSKGQIVHHFGHIPGNLWKIRKYAESIAPLSFLL